MAVFRTMAALALLSSATALHSQRPIAITIETSAGTIRAELDSARAPVTVANFLHYIDQRLYDNGIFHRAVRADNQPNDSVRIAVIQGSIDASRRAESRPAIVLESTDKTGIRHEEGCLSMARSAQPNSARSDFFICVGAQPELNHQGKRNPDGLGFAAFGKVTAGLDIVRRINAMPVESQRLAPPVRIIAIRRG